MIHINCRKLQEEIADDNRMMHRQMTRMLNLKYSDLHFDLLFWTRQMPYKELKFRFCLWQDFGDRLISAVVLDKTVYPLNHLTFQQRLMIWKLLAIFKSRPITHTMDSNTYQKTKITIFISWYKEMDQKTTSVNWSAW